MLFKSKEIYKYKILERYNININEANKQSHNVCELVAKDEYYAFYRYQASSDGSGGYILRQELRNPHKIVFFGESKIFNIVYKNHLFQVNKNGELGRFNITTRNCKTGELTEYNWIGNKAVFLVTPDGYGRFYSQDNVNDVYTKDDRLYFKCYREQSLDPYHKETKPDRFDVTADFTLVVEEKMGKFIATVQFDARDVLSEEEARKRFLQVKDDEWYEEERKHLMEVRKKRMSTSKELSSERKKTDSIQKTPIVNKSSVDSIIPLKTTTSKMQQLGGAFSSDESYIQYIMSNYPIATREVIENFLLVLDLYDTTNNKEKALRAFDMFINNIISDDPMYGLMVSGFFCELLGNNLLLTDNEVSSIRNKFRSIILARINNPSNSV